MSLWLSGFTTSYVVISLLGNSRSVEGAIVSPLATLVDIAAQVVILVLGFLIWSNEVPDSAFAVAAAFVALGAILTTLGVREPEPRAWIERYSLDPPAVGDFTVRGLWFAYR